MATIQETFNTTATPRAYRRTNPIPLDNTSIFYSLDDAENYAKDDPTAYVGQIISVVNSSSVDIYKIIKTDGTLQLVGQNHVGSEAIEVTSTGKNKQIKLKLNNAAETGDFTTVTLDQSSSGLHAKLDLSDYKKKATEAKTTTGAASKTITSLSQSTNGDITATFADIQIETSQVNNLNESLQLLSSNVAGLQTGKVDKQEGYSLISEADKEKLSALDLTDGTITIPTQIATKSIVDLESYLDSKLCTKVGSTNAPLLEESTEDAYQSKIVNFDNLYLQENLRYLLKITYTLEDGTTNTESYFGTAEPSSVGVEGVIDLVIIKETNENRVDVGGATVFQISSFDYEVVDSGICPGLTQDTTTLALTIPGYGSDFNADIFSDYAKYLEPCTIELFEAPENAIIDTCNKKLVEEIQELSYKAPKYPAQRIAINATDPNRPSFNPEIPTFDAPGLMEALQKSYIDERSGGLVKLIINIPELDIYIKTTEFLYSSKMSLFSSGINNIPAFSYYGNGHPHLGTRYFITLWDDAIIIKTKAMINIEDHLGTEWLENASGELIILPELTLSDALVTNSTCTNIQDILSKTE